MTNQQSALSRLLSATRMFEGMASATEHLPGATVAPVAYRTIQVLTYPTMLIVVAEHDELGAVRSRFIASSRLDFQVAQPSDMPLGELAASTMAASREFADAVNGFLDQMPSEVNERVGEAFERNASRVGVLIETHYRRASAVLIQASVASIGRLHEGERVFSITAVETH